MSLQEYHGRYTNWLTGYSVPGQDISSSTRGDNCYWLNLLSRVSYTEQNRRRNRCSRRHWHKSLLPAVGRLHRVPHHAPGSRRRLNKNAGISAHRPDKAMFHYHRPSFRRRSRPLFLVSGRHRLWQDIPSKDPAIPPPEDLSCSSDSSRRP